jgi:hypothetical protein
MMEPTDPVLGFEFAQEIEAETTDKILPRIELRTKNFVKAHKSGVTKRARLEAEELMAAWFVLRNRLDLTEQMLDG